ncbi:MAG: helix-turn-helix domain-containing protein [Pseudomonadota bacterium]
MKFPIFLTNRLKEHIMNSFFRLADSLSAQVKPVHQEMRMAFETIKFEDIAFSHLQQLVENGVSESRTLEYKSAMYKRNDAGRKEALKDLTAFANSDGGHLIIGIEEKKDGSLEFSGGIDGAEADREIQWLESLLRDSVEPRLIGYRIKSISLPGGGAALVIHIPRSWMKPHRTNSKNYYVRNSKCVHEASVSELRTLFLSSQSETDRIRRFVEDRIGALATGNGIMPLSASNLVALHIVPVLSFLENERIDLRLLKENYSKFPTIASSARTCRPNLDGICILDDPNEPSKTYTEIFRNWSIEAVLSDIVGNVNGESGCITPRIVQKIVKLLGNYEQAFIDLGVQYPLAIFVTMIGVKGAKLTLPVDEYDNALSPPIRRDILTLPETILDQPPESEARGPLRLKGTLDALWNAAGEIECPWFDGNGNWKPPH